MFNKPSVFLFFVLLLCCALWVAYSRQSLKPGPRPDSEIPEKKRPVPERPILLFSRIPLPEEDHTDQTVKTGVPSRFRPDQNNGFEIYEPEAEVTPGRIERIIGPLLADRQGSRENLRDFIRSDDPASMEVHSEWLAPHLFPALTLPSLRISFSRDPLTGEFRVLGGALDLFGSGLEAGYETDPDRGEQRGVLQWKKSF